ncbi:MAG TPA: acyl carrier protein [Mycobacteriales bacterium]|nr:acyl carrier protein [Mycobacteriales bacterium]
MALKMFTMNDLARILREGAGVDAGTNLDGDIVDYEFEELGYDSLALLETCGRIEQEYGVTLDDGTVAAARTPRALLDAVNCRLSIPA